MVRLCVYNLNFVYINCFVVVILVVVIRYEGWFVPM